MNSMVDLCNQLTDWAYRSGNDFNFLDVDDTLKVIGGWRDGVDFFSSAEQVDKQAKEYLRFE